MADQNNPRQGQGNQGGQTGQPGKQGSPQKQKTKRVASNRVVASRIKATSQASAKAALREEARTGNHFGRQVEYVAQLFDYRSVRASWSSPLPPTWRRLSRTNPVVRFDRRHPWLASPVSTIAPGRLKNT